MTLHICDNTSVQQLMGLVKTVITIIKIAVPVLLLISVAYSYLKAITESDQDATIKTTKSVVKRLIAAALIYLVPTIVGLLVRISNPDASGFAKCFSLTNNQSEKINL